MAQFYKCCIFWGNKQIFCSTVLISLCIHSSGKRKQIKDLVEKVQDLTQLTPHLWNCFDIMCICTCMYTIIQFCTHKRELLYKWNRLWLYILRSHQPESHQHTNFLFTKEEKNTKINISCLISGRCHMSNMVPVVNTSKVSAIHPKLWMSFIYNHTKATRGKTILCTRRFNKVFLSERVISKTWTPVLWQSQKTQKKSFGLNSKCMYIYLKKKNRMHFISFSTQTIQLTSKPSLEKKTS